MGTGCVSVNRMSGDDADVVIGKWSDGRLGTFRGMQKGKSIYGGTAFTENGAVPVGPCQGYEVLLNEILHFFKTGVVPISKKRDA